MEVLATRFGITADELKVRIGEAVTFFTALEGAGAGTVQVYAFSKPLMFSFYRFDTHVVLATYRHRSDRGPVITMAGDRGGTLYTFVQDEWDWIVGPGIEEGFTRVLHPPNAATNAQA